MLRQTLRTNKEIVIASEARQSSNKIISLYKFKIKQMEKYNCWIAAPISWARNDDRKDKRFFILIVCIAMDILHLHSHKPFTQLLFINFPCCGSRQWFSTTDKIIRHFIRSQMIKTKLTQCLLYSWLIFA